MPIPNSSNPHGIKVWINSIEIVDFMEMPKLVQTTKERVKITKDKLGKETHSHNPHVAEDLTLVLNPHSPSMGYLNSLLKAQELRGSANTLGKLTGRYKDENTGAEVTLSGGSILNAPDLKGQGDDDDPESHEWVIHFSDSSRKLGNGALSAIQSGANIVGTASNLVSILG